MKTTVQRRMLAGVAVALGLAGACGGDDGGDELTKAQLIEQGDAICDEADTTIDGLEGLQQDPFGPGADREAFLDDMDTAIEESEEALADLRELDAPADAEEELEKIYSLREEALNEISEGRAAVEDDDQEKAVPLFESASSKMAEADKLSQEFGFESCGAQ